MTLTPVTPLRENRGRIRPKAQTRKLASQQKRTDGRENSLWSFQHYCWDFEKGNCTKGTCPCAHEKRHRSNTHTPEGAGVLKRARSSARGSGQDAMCLICKRGDKRRWNSACSSSQMNHNTIAHVFSAHT